MKKILLVDDERMTLRVMRQALEKDGFQVDVAHEGAEALEKVTANPPDILITDIDMPKMSGKELCLKIHESMPDRSFPIFVSTSLTALDHRDWTARMSDVKLIEKPISLRKLRAAIRELFEDDSAIATDVTQ